MKQKFKVGDIVQDGTFVSSIKKIENEIAFLTKNYDVTLENLTPVVIGGGFDGRIVLDSIIPMRASYVASGSAVPIRRPKHYLESSIDDIPIASIIEEHGFKYVHELQDWVAKNVPDYFLRMII